MADQHFRKCNTRQKKKNVQKIAEQNCAKVRKLRQLFAELDAGIMQN